MPRTFTLSAQYPAGVELVYAAFAEERYWLARLADSGADTVALESMAVDADGGVDVVTTQGIHRDKLPALAAQFHPGNLNVTRHEMWRPVRDGRARAEVTGKIVGAPAKLSGEAALEPAGGGCELTLTATVQVDIPLVGGKIESFIGAQLAELVAAEQRFTSTWLRQGGAPRPE
ncbi:DUF2505 domain-containing protein [Mycolicibacter algericus]|uniref:DUF2505 domain-containing protein n=3 Tax=Mycolicibacter algericus TaxID=1288388 RepID=A0A7I9YGJ1_MYCAL|nr:DUF2505 domain-containing protein [Mycolicibacter algericus]OQZ97031.1 hypothetical protein BST10_10740 [Mycolicibacter algericus DSM 45454]GFG87788.1 hypothetical protein MALGJ_44640 [Mycolicibacter algericus]